MSSAPPAPRIWNSISGKTPPIGRLDSVSVTAEGTHGHRPVAGSVSINDVTISEGDSGTKVATFTVTRSGGTAAFDVNYATSNATATVADSDYVAASNTLHFGANENTQTISVTINGDTKVEANETFNVVLSNATNGATISDSQGVGTITNDDGALPTNLVVNGGFETGDFTGWTLSGNVAPLSYGPQAFLTDTAQSGQSAAGLGPVGSDGTLSQDIQTTAGQHYTLSFWLANASGGPNDFTAKWNGQTLLAMVNESAQGYTEYTFDVVGTAGTSHLEFDFRQDPSYWSLDSISVTAVGSQAPAVIDAVASSSLLISTFKVGSQAPAAPVTSTFTENADTVTLPVMGGTFNALGGDDRLSYTGGSVTIDGGTGTDTVDFSSFGSAVWVSLAYNGPEIWTMDRADLSGGAWRAIGDLSNVENLVGTPFSDLLRGDGNANVLSYTGGFDTLDGGAGLDTADFSRFGSAVWVDLAYAGNEAWTRDRADVNSGTWREIADLASIENLVGTGGADKLLGDATANRIEGGAGDDVLTGRGGNDTFVFNPGFGNDKITDFDPSNDVILVRKLLRRYG